MPRLRQLDGLRALAVLAVIFSHSSLPHTGGGWLGVTIFFVLSGYLITSILLRQQAGNGVSMRAFYKNRALRLYPALLMVIAVAGCFPSLFGDTGGASTYPRVALTSGLYLEDFVFGFTGHPHGGLGHTWSLGVEEQFYLIWPVALLLLARRHKNPSRWAWAAIVVGFAFICVTSGHTSTYVPDSYTLPFTRMVDLLAGCLVALHLRGRRPVARPALVTVSLLALAGLMLVAASWGRDEYRFGVLNTAGIILSASLLIGLLGNRGLGVTLLSARPLAYLGHISYGLYLWSVVVSTLVSRYAHPSSRSVDFLVDLGLTVVVASISYELVEKRFLAMKSRASAAPAPSRPGHHRHGCRSVAN